MSIQKRNKNDSKIDYALAVGSNIRPERHIPEAFLRLRQLGAIQSVSSVYQTAPVGKTDQADFHNLVLWLHTELEPVALLRHCQQIEADLGRQRNERWGPRTLDLDLILTDPFCVIQEPNLVLPHPRWQERAFVVAPLLELEELAPRGLDISPLFSRIQAGVLRLGSVQEVYGCL